jgi:hypothetical protein
MQLCSFVEGELSEISQRVEVMRTPPLRSATCMVPPYRNRRSTCRPSPAWSSRPRTFGSLLSVSLTSGT